VSVPFSQRPLTHFSFRSDEYGSPDGIDRSTGSNSHVERDYQAARECWEGTMDRGTKRISGYQRQGESSHILPKILLAGMLNPQQIRHLFQPIVMTSNPHRTVAEASLNWTV
jgi:hypothetical protein